MLINLDKIDYYYLTIPENVERIKHIKSEFSNYNIIEVNPVPYKNIKGNYSDKVRKLKSGITGFLKIIDFVMHKYNNGVFKPFIIIEDDVKKYRDIPNEIEIPSDSDICYIGLSRWGMTNITAHGVENSVCYQDINSEIIKVQNMLSTHGIMVTSLRGITTLQKCLMEDYYLNRGWDMCLSQIQPFINAYALKQPLVYQYKKVGGQEQQTKIDYTQLNNKTLPDQWINNTNLSNISIYKPVKRTMKIINFGILVYQNQYTKYSSRNIGDYIQSLAAINIYKKFINKLTNNKYESFPDFVNLVLNNSIPNFNFIFIKRDNMHDISQYNGHTDIITIMNGWWMWPYNKDNDISFTIPSNITPIFVSFHIYNNKLLLDNNIKQFKKFEPIGCRDLKTLEKLQNKGVEAYFSGCLTLTIDFFKWRKTDTTYYVDLPNYHNNKNGIEIKHCTEAITNNYMLGFQLAIKFLKLYSESNKVYTSRLHAYLPCIAMNVPVDFLSLSDKKVWGCGHERFGGLQNLANEPEKCEELKNKLNNDVINFIEKLTNPDLIF
jgi:hypothetical protein